MIFVKQNGITTISKCHRAFTQILFAAGSAWHIVFSHTDEIFFVNNAANIFETTLWKICRKHYTRRCSNYLLYIFLDCEKAFLHTVRSTILTVGKQKAFKSDSQMSIEISKYEMKAILLWVWCSSYHILRRWGNRK